MISLGNTSQAVQTLALALLPHGGQHTARQNAWASVSQDAVHARARQDAARSVEVATLRSMRRTAQAL